MIIYEVTAVVDSDLEAAYQEYMRTDHIPDLLETGCFLGAVFSKGEGGRYRIQYQAPDQESLNRYFSVNAQKLRADLVQHFPTGVELSREMWTVKQTWHAESA